MQLLPFQPCESLRVGADVHRRGSSLEFTYDIDGDSGDIVIPPPLAHPQRCDGLWQATCFEAFIAIGRTSYIELNFAPSGCWAAYRFSNYRQGMVELDIDPPKITFQNNCLTANVQIGVKPGEAFNLTAVIEHRSRLRSYWALSHPAADRPDFHTRDCFVAKLA